MLFHRFPFALLVATLLLAHSVGAMAQAIPTYNDIAADKKDSPPRPKPKPGPRDGGDEN